MLLLVVAFAVQYLSIGARLNDSMDNDSAYYFGVAGHIVRTGRFEEPLVWQFLARHSSGITHPPFDYWQGLTTLLLIPPFLLFGVSHSVAGITMAVFSGLGLLCFWRLTTRGALRSPPVQFVALVLFALSPALRVYRFDSESVVVFQLLLLASLWAYAEGRHVLSVVTACLLMITRGDGLAGC